MLIIQLPFETIQNPSLGLQSIPDAGEWISVLFEHQDWVFCPRHPVFRHVTSWLLFSVIACAFECNLDCRLVIKSLLGQVSKNFSNIVLSLYENVFVFPSIVFGCLFHFNLLDCYNMIVHHTIKEVKQFGCIFQNCNYSAIIDLL